MGVENTQSNNGCRYTAVIHSVLLLHSFLLHSFLYTHFLLIFIDLGVLDPKDHFQFFYYTHFLLHSFFSIFQICMDLGADKLFWIYEERYEPVKYGWINEYK